MFGDYSIDAVLNPRSVKVLHNSVINNYVSSAEDIQPINDIDNNKVDILSPGDISLTSVEPETTTKIVQQTLVCPNKQTRVPFFSPNCKTTRDSLFGVIERVCPINPMPEFLSIQECVTDDDCGRRICCPEHALQGGISKSYCRNAAPRFNRMPAVRQFLLPLKSFASYLQCSPPPPPFLDVFPRPCKSPFDCFPNLCCQEHGKRVCRPPQKSLFALIVSTATRGTSSLAKRFIQRIS
ncbi:hypothetical protein ILUMI_26699 [Ignelater luminosus]|uniref:Uncharacterized protein n=1 Tax=Ignelater luminosus TaxID=2038154 RepID=A0A8K0C9B9_IGNLU|nr:hypothetical protein ILUMI_26699 [Ignelater luminosus]